MILDANPTTWHTPVLAGAGLVSALRAAIGLFNPDYWSPQASLDYAAATSTSLAFVCLSAGLWGFYRSQPALTGRAQNAWRSALMICCISAGAIGVSNFLEDALGMEGLGAVWVVGILALLAGLLVAGASAFWVQGPAQWAGGLLLTCAVGLLFISSWGFWGMGLALLALAFLDSNFSRSPSMQGGRS